MRGILRQRKTPPQRLLSGLNSSQLGHYAPARHEYRLREMRAGLSRTKYASPATEFA